jgi:hypothetical protein
MTACEHHRVLAQRHEEGGADASDRDSRTPHRVFFVKRFWRRGICLNEWLSAKQASEGGDWRKPLAR